MIGRVIMNLAFDWGMTRYIFPMLALTGASLPGNIVLQIYLRYNANVRL